MLIGLYLALSLRSPAIKALTTTETWVRANDLLARVSSRSAIFHNNYIYLLGGRDQSSDPTSNVYRAQIVNGVVLSAWTQLGGMPSAIYSHASVVANNYLYVIGGWDGSNVRTKIMRASLLGDGSLGAWEEISDFPMKIQAHVAVHLNHYIYVVGGADNSGSPIKAVYFARVADNGTLDPWQQTSPLPYGILAHAVVAHNDYLYTIGGYDGKQARGEIYRAPVGVNGTLGGWEPVVPLPPPARYYSGALVRQGELVVLGGTDGSTALTEVVAAQFNADGKLGQWQRESALPEPRYRFGVVVGNLNQIYMIGGSFSSSNHRNEVYVLAEPANVACGLTNHPFGWLTPSATVDYTIRCQVGPTFPVSNVILTNNVPTPLVLDPSSLQGNPEVNSSQLTWRFNTLAPGAEVRVGYSAQRPPLPIATPPPPSASGLSILKSAEPAYVATASEVVTYTLVVANRNATAITGTFVLTDQLPVGVTLEMVVRDSVTATTTGLLTTGSITATVLPSPANQVQWIVANVELASQATITGQFAIIAPPQTLVNDTYAVQHTDGLYSAVGSEALTVYAGPEKDGFVAMNLGTLVAWQSVGGNSQGLISNSAMNSPFNLFLPIVQR